MAKQNSTRIKKQPSGKSDDFIVLKVLVAFVLMILSLVALHAVGKSYVTADGFGIVYPGTLLVLYICIPVFLVGVVVPFFWKKPLVREIGSYLAILALLAGVSAFLFRLYWTDYLHFLYFLHLIVYCLYMIFLLYRTEFFLVSLVTGLAGGVFYTFYHGISASFSCVFLGAALIVSIVCSAVLANLAEKNNGTVHIAGKKFPLFPAGFNPLVIYIVCAVWLVCLIASLLLGSLFSYYCMFAAIAIELIAAVYYTFQLK